jgi:hypothetical protein
VVRVCVCVYVYIYVSDDSRRETKLFEQKNIRKIRSNARTPRKRDLTKRGKTQEAHIGEERERESFCFWNG